MDKQENNTEIKETFESKADFEEYAKSISNHLDKNAKYSKFKFVYLKNLNDLLAQNLSETELKDLIKAVSKIYNSKLNVNKKKDKGPSVVMLGGKGKAIKNENFNEVEYDDYYDEDDDDDYYEEEVKDNKNNKIKK